MRTNDRKKKKPIKKEKNIIKFVLHAPFALLVFKMRSQKSNANGGASCIASQHWAFFRLLRSHSGQRACQMHWHCIRRTPSTGWETSDRCTGTQAAKSAHMHIDIFSKSFRPLEFTYYVIDVVLWCCTAFTHTHSQHTPGRCVIIVHYNTQSMLVSCTYLYCFSFISVLNHSVVVATHRELCFHKPLLKNRCASLECNRSLKREIIIITTLCTWAEETVCCLEAGLLPLLRMPTDRKSIGINQK